MDHPARLLDERRSARELALTFARHQLEGVLRQTVYQGDSLLLVVDAGDGQEIRVRVAAGRASQADIPAPGGRVALALHRDDAIVLAGAPA